MIPARFRLLSVLWVAVLLYPAIGSTQRASPAADMAAINTILADLLRAYQERNLAGVAGLMANEVQAFGSTFTAHGLEEFRSRAPETLRDVRGVRVVGNQDVTMSGNLAYVAFVTDVMRDMPGGARTSRARWTVVFQRTNNRWVIVHYHVSPDPAAGAAAR